MVYIAGIKKDKEHVRLHAPGYDSANDAVADFVAKRGIYSGDWVRLDQKGPPRHIRYEEIVDVQPGYGPTHID